MRRAYEPLFRRFKVDVVLNGHSHAYERTKPMYGWRADGSGCGTVHVMLGGGCANDLTFGYIDEERAMPYLPLKPSYCPCAKGVPLLQPPAPSAAATGANATARAAAAAASSPLPSASSCPRPDPANGGRPSKPCPYAYCELDPDYFRISAYQPPLVADGKYGPAPECTKPTAEFPDPLCPAAGQGPPAWSAYRRTTFGVGQLELLSPTEARWSWFANNFNTDGPKRATDTVLMRRDPSLSCGSAAAAAAAAP
jgi:acid phosphatase type 7